MTQDKLLTVICHRVKHDYLERVMTQEEFDKFNEEFKNDGNDSLWSGDCLINKFSFEDWEYGNGISGEDFDDHFFKAYPGDVRNGSDDLVSIDNGSPWQEPFTGEKLVPREHSNYFIYLKEKNQ
jgi:hypothetical protein